MSEKKYSRKITQYIVDGTRAMGQWINPKENVLEIIVGMELAAIEDFQLLF